MLKIGTLVVTNKGRYGTIIMVDEQGDSSRYLLKMGLAQHWVYSNQVVPVNHLVRFKVDYEINHCGMILDDSIEIKFKKDSVLFKDGVDKFYEMCKDAVEAQLNTKVKIKQIKIA